MNDKQFESVLALDDIDRYKHFISKVGDWQQLWGVKGPDDWFFSTEHECKYFPLWPHPEYAQKAVNEKYFNYTVTEISLEDLLDDWLPLCVIQKVKIAVFPNQDWMFLCAEPNDLKEAILMELKQYE